MVDYKFKYKPEPDLVSIIIPTHNRSDLIVETLDSFNKQSYNCIEIIIVDDHSKDNTKDIIDKYSANSRFPIRYITSDGFGGCHARNIGLINSKGSYIQFFDDDDLVDEDFIYYRLNEIKKNELDFCTCNFNIFSDETKFIVGSKRIDNIEHSILSHLYHYALPTPCFLFKRSALVKINFWNEKVARLQDMSYYHRIFRIGLKGQWMDKTLFRVRQHPKNITSQIKEEGLINAWIEICKEWNNNKEVSLFCINRMWEYLKISMKRGDHKSLLLYFYSILSHFPYLFIFYLIKIKLLKHKELIYKA